MIKLPCNPVTFVDPSTVVCVRAVPEDGMVVVHTNQGFAVPATPLSDDDSLRDLVADIVNALDACTS